MPNRSHFETHEAYLEWYREYREKNRTKVREYSRVYIKTWRIKNDYADIKRWRAKNPEKLKAQRKIQGMIQRGTIVRQPCEICGQNNAQAHHEDYKYPEQIRWLCPIHHRMVHLGTLVLIPNTATCVKPEKMLS